MKLLFLLTQLFVFLFLAVNLGQRLQRTGLLRPELENVLQRLAGVPVGVIIDVLPRQAIPVINLPLAAPVFNPAFQAQSAELPAIFAARVDPLLHQTWRAQRRATEKAFFAEPRRRVDGAENQWKCPCGLRPQARRGFLRRTENRLPPRLW